MCLCRRNSRCRVAEFGGLFERDGIQDLRKSGISRGERRTPIRICRIWRQCTPLPHPLRSTNLMPSIASQSSKWRIHNLISIISERRFNLSQWMFSNGIAEKMVWTTESLGGRKSDGIEAWSERSKFRGQMFASYCEDVMRRARRMRDKCAQIANQEVTPNVPQNPRPTHPIECQLIFATSD